MRINIKLKYQDVKFKLIFYFSFIQDVNACDTENGCFGESVCVDENDFETTSDNGFICTCPDGFDGVLCDNNIDECATADCENETCVDGLNSFLCQCNLAGPFFTGDKCEDDGCGDNGIWNAVDSKCDCDAGYSGQVCDVFDACINETCSGNWV